MYIDKIDLNNFRIYYGENIITIAPSSKRNVCVISGDNGYGKTTLRAMALLVVTLMKS